MGEGEVISAGSSEDGHSCLCSQMTVCSLLFFLVPSQTSASTMGCYKIGFRNVQVLLYFRQALFNGNINGGGRLFPFFFLFFGGGGGGLAGFL